MVVQAGAISHNTRHSRQRLYNTDSSLGEEEEQSTDLAARARREVEKKSEKVDKRRMGKWIGG